MPQPYPDKYSALSQGLLQGVQMGGQIGQLINQGERNRLYDKRYSEQIAYQKERDEQQMAEKLLEYLYKIKDPAGRQAFFQGIKAKYPNHPMIQAIDMEMSRKGANGNTYQTLQSAIKAGNMPLAMTIKEELGVDDNNFKLMVEDVKSSNEKEGMQNTLLSQQGVSPEETFENKTYNMEHGDYNKIDRTVLGSGGQGLLGGQFRLVTPTDVSNRYSGGYHSALSEEDQREIAMKPNPANNFSLLDNRPSLFTSNKSYSTDTPEQTKARTEIKGMNIKTLEDRLKGEKPENITGQFITDKDITVGYSDKLGAVAYVGGKTVPYDSKIHGDKQHIKGMTQAGAANLAHQLRSEIKTNPYVKEFQDINNKFSVMEKAMEQSTKTGNLVAVDQALITLFNKMTDPSSVVRESEYVRTPENLSLWNRFMGKIEKYGAGGAGITQADRQALIDMARKFHESYATNYDETIQNYKELAKETGISEKLIGIPYERKTIKTTIDSPVSKTPPTTPNHKAKDKEGGTTTLTMPDGSIQTFDASGKRIK